MPVLAALALALACSGGGGAPSAPLDTTPPPVPTASRVHATLPAAGATTVTGDPGAVEASSMVTATNVATGGTGQTAASADGAFSLQLPASIGDAIRLTARDAAGNESGSLSVSAGPAASSIRVGISAGNGQIAVSGRPLPDSLRVRVTAPGGAVAGVPVRFLAPGGGTLSAAKVTTDAGGFASVAYSLGSGVGPRTVRAEILSSGTGHISTFELEAVGSPVIESVSPTVAPGGATLTINGRNFSPVDGHTTVSVQGTAAPILSVTRTHVQTMMPHGLTGQATVQVSLTGVSSAPAQVQVMSGSIISPPVGQAVFATAPNGAGTAFVPFQTGTEEYVVAIEAATPFSSPFTLMVNGGVPVQGSRAPLTPTAAVPDVDAEVLAHGYRLLADRGPAPRATRALVPADSRTFWVLNVPESVYEQRDARLGYDGSKVAVYVDDAIPEADFPTSEAEALGQSFESSVYGTIRAVYGSESDLDGNGKPIILLTPLVNTRSTDEGTVLGFFNPGDLADHAASNRGEIFYLLTPDPNGTWGFATPPAPELRDLLVSVAAHEFVHMISANERSLLRSLPGQSYWLEEGLAHYGEHLVDRLGYANIVAYLQRGSPSISLVGTHLLTRGAATLFVARLVERFGAGVLRQTMTGPGTSTVTAAAATGRPWEDLFHDWSLAMYNELYPVPGIAPRFDSLDLIGRFSFDHGSPIQGNALGIFDRTLPDLVSASTAIGMHEGAVAFVRVTGGAPGELGELRFEALRSVGLQVTTIRIK